MTARELINQLMNLDLDSPVYLAEIPNVRPKFENVVGYATTENSQLINSKFTIKEVGVHGFYGARFNYIVLKERDKE